MISFSRRPSFRQPPSQAKTGQLQGRKDPPVHRLGRRYLSRKRSRVKSGSRGEYRTADEKKSLSNVHPGIHDVNGRTGAGRDLFPARLQVEKTRPVSRRHRDARSETGGNDRYHLPGAIITYPREGDGYWTVSQCLCIAGFGSSSRGVLEFGSAWSRSPRSPMYCRRNTEGAE